MSGGIAGNLGEDSGLPRLRGWDSCGGRIPGNLGDPGGLDRAARLGWIAEGKYGGDMGPPSEWREGYPLVDGCGGLNIPVFHDIPGVVDGLNDGLLRLVVKGHLRPPACGDDGCAARTRGDVKGDAVGDASDTTPPLARGDGGDSVTPDKVIRRGGATRTFWTFVLLDVRRTGVTMPREARAELGSDVL